MRTLALFISAICLANSVGVKAVEPCDTDQDLAAIMLSDGAPIFLLGEIHGTKEIVDVFSDLICTSSHARPTLVILEFSTGHQDHLDAFLDNPNKDLAAGKFLESDLWSLRLADGRSSVAAWNLFMRIYDLRSAGAPIEVRFVQPVKTVGLPQAYYEIEMAFNLAAARAEHRAYFTLGLLGRVHAGKSEFSNGAQAFKPAAALLPGTDVISLRFDDLGGSAWNCTVQGCGETQRKGNPTSPPTKAAGLYQSVFEGYDGFYSVLRDTTASPPMISSIFAQQVQIAAKESEANLAD